MDQLGRKPAADTITDENMDADTDKNMDTNTDTNMDTDKDTKQIQILIIKCVTDYGG